MDIEKPSSENDATVDHVHALPGKSGSSVLRTYDLCHSFGSFKVVKNMNLNVPEGQIYGFLGRNGAGKTTTIRMLMGIIRPQSGEIELLGSRGRKVNTRAKQEIGYVSQHQYFYPWMSCERLGAFVSGFYKKWDKGEFQRLLKVLDLPPGRKISHLSGGMRMKLALAVALAHNPALLILDEPTSGLDPVARREFLDTIQRQSRAHNRTTFFSTHLIDEVERVADQVGILHRGELMYEGDITQLHESVRSLHVSAPVKSIQAEQDGLEGAPAISDHPTSLSHQRDLICRSATERGFKVVRADAETPDQVTLMGSPELWSSYEFEEATIERLSLEDIFIQMVGEATPDL